jgi:tetratricopeptide (TPR) repeat protein
MRAAVHGFDDGAAAAFADSAIGGGLSPEVEGLIALAGLLRDRPEEALPLLERARAAAPRHPAPLIAIYRFHFYGHRLAEARAAGTDALAIARTALGPDFGDQPPTDDAARHDAAVRFYLFTLKGLAYLGLRLGDLEEARLLLGELRRLDPQDRVGGALLGHVLARHEEGDAAGAGESPAAYPAYGWAGGAR